MLLKRNRVKSPAAVNAAVVVEPAVELQSAVSKLQISDIAPNPWNMNQIDHVSAEKLWNGMQKVRVETGSTPPVIVRRNPDSRQSLYQIIDGEQRWTLARDGGPNGGSATQAWIDIDAIVLPNVSDVLAKMLTNTLNYLKGSPQPDRYNAYIADLARGVPLEELASYLPHSLEELQEFCALEEIEPVIVDMSGAESLTADTDDASETEHFVELKFVLSQAQVEVFERALARIAGLLRGKNIRGRALEYMAVLSEQTPLEPRR